MVEQFANEAIDILLEWTVQEEIHGLIFNISAFPQADIQYTEMKNANMTLSYNVQYIISVL